MEAHTLITNSHRALYLQGAEGVMMTPIQNNMVLFILQMEKRFM